MLIICPGQALCPLLGVSVPLRQAHPSLAGFGVSVPLSSAIAQLLEVKRRKNLKPVYIKSLAYYLARFAAGREARALDSVTTREVEEFLNKFAAPATRATWQNRINTLFAFAVRRELLAKNPCAPLERVVIERRAPKILSPGEAQLLLNMASSVVRPYLILGLFAGIRPDELMRLKWEDVCLETKTVTVNEAKTRRRRIVPLHGRAVTLLAACPLKTGPVSPSNSTVRRFKRAARVALGWTSWPSDLLRHTAASYLMAVHQDAGKVATMLGNSAGVLLNHYHQPVKVGACGEFWAGVEKRTP